MSEIKSSRIVASWLQFFAAGLAPSAGGRKAPGCLGANNLPPESSAPTIAAACSFRHQKRCVTPDLPKNKAVISHMIKN
ncbi:MAG: hypothetical protein KDJ73_09345 [Notoacmeibacter sp.]|nr:hypothetical protein [Notoacmeibacter sp.]MCC0032323.1 hypothetical protein [Brucellaceae bacterium]